MRSKKGSKRNAKKRDTCSENTPHVQKVLEITMFECCRDAPKGKQTTHVCMYVRGRQPLTKLFIISLKSAISSRKELHKKIKEALIRIVREKSKGVELLMNRLVVLSSCRI